MGTLEENTANVARAHEQYMEGATGLPVQDDHDARVALSQEAKTVVLNPDLATDLNATLVDIHGVEVPVYSGGNRINVAANRAGVDEFPETSWEVEDLEHEALVAKALDDGDLFVTGGQIPPTSYESNDDNTS